jgi:hypothetical protein
MRNLFRKCAAILDGTPTEYGQRGWRGQSVAELALVTPLLIAMLMALVEMGWFANTYLILLEASRAGARFATTLPPERSPLDWPNDASIYDVTSARSRAARQEFNCRDSTGFYSDVLCTTIDSLRPMVMDANQDTIADRAFDGVRLDDIVISAFALKQVNPATVSGLSPGIITGGGMSSIRPLPNVPAADPAGVPGLTANSPRIVIVGRYPTNANECGTMEPRDPFDYFTNNTRDYRYVNPALLPDPTIEENRNYVELEGMDAGTDSGFIGFSYLGNHVSNDPTNNNNCRGSDWTTIEVERLVNLPNWSLPTNAERVVLPDRGGLIIVEIFWRHELLLDSPILATMIGTLDALDSPIAVWAAFPLTATEPLIDFSNY